MSTLVLRSKLPSSAMSRTQVPDLSPVLLPALLFTSLAFAARHFVLGNFDRAGGLLSSQCHPDAGPNSIRYFGVGPIDEILCLFVAFYRTSFDPTLLPFTAAYWVSLTSPIALSLVEAARSGRSTLLAFPAILSLVYHFQGAGFAFSLFWLTFIILGHTRLDRVAARIDQPRAEAALFAVLAGYVLPYTLMLILQDPFTTAVCQFLPVWLWMARAAYLFIRPSSRYNASGYWAVQATFIYTFIASAMTHIAVIQAVNDLTLLKDLYLPPIVAPNPATTNVQRVVHETLQWDGIIASGSSLLGTLWFARNAKQVVLITLWNVIATTIVGPGAALSGVLLWREWALNGAPEDVSKKKW